MITKEKVNVKDQIIEKILEGFGTDDNPTLPWKKTWIGRILQPHNPISGNNYNGMNNFWLFIIQGIIAEEKKLEDIDPRWCTFIQAKSKGYRIRKGEKSTPISFYSPGFNKTNDDGEEVYIKSAHKTFSVFNFTQLEGDNIPPLEIKKFDWKYDEKFDELLNIFDVRLCHEEGDRSFYRPLTDKIHLPVRSQFKTSEGYYGTLFHEIIHWTGHETRLHRFDNGIDDKSEKYAFEELVAEIGSLFLKERLGCENTDDGFNNSISYIQTWKRTIKEDKEYFFKAIKEAERAVKFLMDKLGISSN